MKKNDFKAILDAWGIEYDNYKLHPESPFSIIKMVAEKHLNVEGDAGAFVQFLFDKNDEFMEMNVWEALKPKKE